MRKNIVAYLTLVIGLLIFSGCSHDSIEPTTKIDDKVIDNSEIQKVDQQATSHSTLKVHYLDVGQADATLLQLFDQDETINLLIDTGDWNTSDVVTYLHSQNIEDIDIIAVTHPHADHIGQLDKIIEDFSVTEVWMNGETATSQVFAKSLEAIEKHDVDYYEPEVGEIFDIGPLEITVLHPDALSANTNNNSLAMRLQYGEVSFLFTGDAEQQAENAIPLAARTSKRRFYISDTTALIRQAHLILYKPSIQKSRFTRLVSIILMDILMLKSLIASMQVISRFTAQIHMARLLLKQMVKATPS